MAHKYAIKELESTEDVNLHIIIFIDFTYQVEMFVFEVNWFILHINFVNVLLNVSKNGVSVYWFHWF